MFKVDFRNSLEKEFFLKNTTEVAKNLIGKSLVKQVGNGSYVAGLIVETEAYLSKNDLSSHSACGLTLRNAPMFEEGGILYVYKIYGLHHCINIVTEVKSRGCAVLLRALEPFAGLDIMISNRNNKNIKMLCKGPGNLAKAFDFSLDNNYNSLLEQKLFIQKYKKIKPEEIGISTRVGSKKSSELPLRFYLKKSEYISGKIF